jgi:hypothetical protein
MRSIPLGSMIFLLLRRAGFPFFKEIWNEMTASIKESRPSASRRRDHLRRPDPVQPDASGGLSQHAGERRHAYLEQIAAQIVAV